MADSIDILLNKILQEVKKITAKKPYINEIKVYRNNGSVDNAGALCTFINLGTKAIRINNIVLSGGASLAFDGSQLNDYDATTYTVTFQDNNDADNNLVVVRKNYQTPRI